MKTLTPSINLDAEVDALAQFTLLKWTRIEQITELFTEIRELAFQVGRGWFDPHPVWLEAGTLGERRLAVLRQALGPEFAPTSDLYDALSTTLRGIRGTVHSLRDVGLALDGPWKFDKSMDMLTSALVERYPTLANARPLAWAEALEGYVEFSGQAQYDLTKDAALFQGVDVRGSRDAAFPERLALPYVLSESIQGLAPSRVLVAAVFSHFLGIAERLNTVRMVKSLRELMVSIIDTPGMVHELQLVPRNPMLKFMLSELPQVPTSADFAGSLARLAEFNRMTPDEQDACRRASQAAALSVLGDLLDGASHSEQAAYEKEQAELLEKAARLNQCINETVQ